MNSTHYSQHPFSRGYFATYGAELKAARGKPSSRDFEKWARECDQCVQASMSSVSYFDQRLEEVEQEEARFIAEQPEQRAQIKAIADEMRQRFESARKWRLDAARQHRERAQEMRQYAKQSRAFEARWAFNPYIDPFLDLMERQQHEEARAAKRKIKNGPKSKVRARG